MFKSNGTIYILIPLNIFIWGFFIYRFYTAYTEGDLPVADNKMQAVKLDNIKDSIEYKLSLNYKDPFLREGEKQKVNYNLNSGSPTEKKPTVIKTPTVTEIKQLPDIKYLGLIKNTSSGAATALVSVNGQSKLIKTNDVIDGITFKNFDQDNLTAQWGKEKIVVRK